MRESLAAVVANAAVIHMGEPARLFPRSEPAIDARGIFHDRGSRIDVGNYEVTTTCPRLIVTRAALGDQCPDTYWQAVMLERPGQPRYAVADVDTDGEAAWVLSLQETAL